MDLMTTAEVAELLRTPPATLRYWRHCGVGPASFRMGKKRVIYRRQIVLDWLAEQERADPRTPAA